METRVLELEGLSVEAEGHCLLRGISLFLVDKDVPGFTVGREQVAELKATGAAEAATGAGTEELEKAKEGLLGRTQ